MVHPKLKLWYFELPGRAETTRIMLDYAGISFENANVTRDDWPRLKTQFPFGQVPVLEVDGKQLAQSVAIERYVAHVAGLYPTDPWQAAKVEELVEFEREITDLFMPSFRIQDLDAKIKARQEVVEGPLKPKLEKLTQMLEAAGGQFLTGDKPTWADIRLFKDLSGFVGGVMDGVPTTLLNDYPALKAHHNRVAELPGVAKRYEAVKEGMLLSYKPLP